MKHVISVRQFEDKKFIEDIFAEAARLKGLSPSEYPKSLQNKVVATLFYEPSTRTRLSFETATLKLGGQVISTENAGETSSNVKGETLEDTIRTINGYADAIVLRHPALGSAELAARYSAVPIVNAGDGGGDHPTQALLDLFTILECKKDVNDLKIGLVGDLMNGRAIHSLAELLGLYKPEIYCIAPPSLQLPANYLDGFRKNAIDFKQLDTWESVIDELDVIYIPRVQKERFDSLEEYEKFRDSFIVNAEAMKRIKKDAIIMSPLPRVTEIAPEIDNDPRAVYFEQARNGLYVRMALLQALFV